MCPSVNEFQISQDLLRNAVFFYTSWEPTTIALLKPGDKNIKKEREHSYCLGMLPWVHKLAQLVPFPFSPQVGMSTQAYIWWKGELDVGINLMQHRTCRLGREDGKHPICVCIFVLLVHGTGYCSAVYCPHASTWGTLYNALNEGHVCTKRQGCHSLHFGAPVSKGRETTFLGGKLEVYNSKVVQICDLQEMGYFYFEILSRSTMLPWNML